MMVLSETTVEAWVDAALEGWPEWAKWGVWALLGLAVLAVVLLPYWLARCGARLDRAMCKEGKVTTGLGGLTAWVALLAAVWRGIAPAYALWNRHAELHGAWHETKNWVIGMDLTAKVRYPFPWGVGTIPEEVGLILDGLKIWWYVPLAGMALVWLMRSWKFRSPAHALLDAVVQTGIALAIYWGYGLLLGGYLLQFAARLGAAVAVLVGGVFLGLVMLKTWWEEATGKNRAERDAEYDRQMEQARRMREEMDASWREEQERERQEREWERDHRVAEDRDGNRVELERGFLDWHDKEGNHYDEDWIHDGFVKKD